MFTHPRMRRPSLAPAQHRARAFRTNVERMEDRQLLATLLGLTNQNELVRFDSATPGTIQATTPITGLASGESILGIDYRPATGQLYGLSSANQVYVINASSGAAGAVGAAFSATLTGSKTAVDFNPAADRLRVVTSGTSNIRVNQLTGALAATDTNLAYAATDPGAGTTPSVTAVAYTNSVFGAASTTLYGIDQARGVLVTQGSVAGATPVVSPNTGQLFTVGSLGASIAATGFDIAANEGKDFGKAFVTGTASGSTTPTLYTVDLTTGAATSVGAIGVSGRTISDVAVVPRVETIFAVAAANDTLVGGTTLLSFASNNPTQILTTQTITGLQSGESILDIDVRPATGQLYGLGSTGRVYTIDTTTAAATQVGSAPAFTPTGRAAIDFNPVPDRIRVVTADGQNLRLNPDTGALAATDTAVAYATGDANFGKTPGITSVAYTNSVAGATGTTLYAFDGTILTTQGSLQGAATVVSPNTGQLFTVATSTATPTAFDIAAARNVAYIATAGAGSGLAAINLTTGAATTVGAIGSGLVIRGLAVAPTGQFKFSVTSVTVDESTGNAAITVTRTGGSSGEASVDFATSDGTGIAGTDYTATGGTLVFADGETSKTINVPILNNVAGASDSAFNLTLSNATAGASVPAAGATTTVTINNTTPTGQFGFSVTSVAVDETSGNAVITVTRSGGSSGAATVDFATADGTGIAGTDYTATSGTLTFADGETSKTINVPILNNVAGASDTTFTLMLSNATPGTSVPAAGATATVTINNTTPTGQFGFGVTSATVNENAGQVIITVTRTGGSGGAASVDYATADGTGVAGTDYTATSGTLNFADGETSKTIAVPILNNAGRLSNSTFTLMLSNATPGTGVPAAGATTTVTINNTTPTPPPVDVTSPTIIDVSLKTNGLQRVARILVTFSEAVNVSTLTTANFLLTDAGRDGRPGNADDRPLAIQSITYDAMSRTATIVPGSKIKLGQKFGLSVNGGTTGVADSAGNRLNGAGTGNNPGNFFAGLAIGSKIQYFDADGDKVELKVKNGGVAELRLNLDGTTKQVRLLNTRRGRTRLEGDVDRKHKTGNGSVFIGTLTGTQGVRLKLSNREFRIGTTA